MAKDVNPPRRYDSPRRREQASATRRAILDAARVLFIERGYAGASIEAIAERASVSPATVYGVFGNKRSILATLVDVSIAGDDAPVAIVDRPWVAELRAEPDLRRRIRMLARNGRRILERRSPIDSVLDAAAATDREIASLWQRVREERHAGQRRMLELVRGDARLRRGVTLDRAADTFYAVASPESYRLLVEDRGWSPDRFERWIADALERLVFDIGS